MPNTCGAKTRSGIPCANTAVMASGRCRMHGGSSTGAPVNNANAVSHGIFRKHLTPEENLQYDALSLGSVDNHLRLMNIRLARALDAEARAEGEPELDEVTENEGGGPASVAPDKITKSKMRDYVGIIDRITARIESLEKTRLALGGSDTVEDMNADGLTRGKPDEDGPPNPVR